MNIFYKIGQLTKEEKITLFTESYEVCYKWWLDKLDCQESFRRKRIPDATFKEALSHFSENALSTMIFRSSTFTFEQPHLEIGFRSMDSHVDYFLWILVSSEKSKYFIEKYTEGKLE